VALEKGYAIFRCGRKLDLYTSCNCLITKNLLTSPSDDILKKHLIIAG
jgi:hypothetical protein